MFSASKFWPPRLLGRDKTKGQTAFVPGTAMAARIVGQAKDVAKPAKNAAPPSPFPNSFELMTDPIEEPALVPDALEDPVDLSRQAERFVPDRAVTTLTDSRGKSVKARIINISATGVAVEADFSQIAAENVVLVGQKPVFPGRGIRRGQVFLFEKPLDPARCNAKVVL